MILIGENIHIVSKTIRSALLARDEDFIKRQLLLQKNMNYVDLNIGPGNGEVSDIFPWLCPLVEANSDLKISLDTTNLSEMKKAFKHIKNTGDVILNSTSADEPRISIISDLAIEYDCSFVALTMSKASGIPSTSDGRMETAFEIYEKLSDKNLVEKTFFDPLILPVTSCQIQAKEALDTLKTLKEAFENSVKTIIGLSNISNGAPSNLRPLLNQVYAVLAFGAGVDAIIMDGGDEELFRILKMLQSERPNSEIDKLYIRLADMIRNFSDLEEIRYDKEDYAQVKIIKACEVLLNKKIYSDSFAQV